MMKESPIDIYRKHGGQLRMSEASAHGITRYMLYTMKDKGIIEQVSRGVYRLAELPPISNPDLVTVSLQSPQAVICLVSALSYHHITTEIPHAVTMAVLEYPPIQVHRFSGDAYKAGVKHHTIDGVSVRIYNPEKTLADCFKFRNKIGMDVFLEAVKLYNSRQTLNIEGFLSMQMYVGLKK